MTSIWVYTSENHGTSIEVPLTPETTVLDVLDCVRDPVRGEGYLVAVAGDTEYILQEGDNAFTFLYEIWNNSGSPLTFLLRYYNQQAEWPPPELEARRHQMRRPHKELESSNMTGKLPGGTGDLTLAELQEMASRQQQQMGAQQQVLVAKEQRLKYLKQQEARHAQLASESERLRQIRERVGSQELKLKKLRALRGQAEQHRTNNGNLNSELDAVKAVFNEKEKELAVAVARVDQLTRQLQDLRNGAKTGLMGNKQALATAELEKLRKELLIRNKLNEQQSNTISAKEKLLNQRRDEVTRMDARIHELHQRLKKKRLQEQQAAMQSQTNKSKPTNQQSANSNVATVEPYIQYAPHHVVKDDSFTKTGGFQKQDPKYQTLPSNVKFVQPGKPLEEFKPGKALELNNNTEVIEDYKLPTVLPMDTSSHYSKHVPNHHPVPAHQFQQQPSVTRSNQSHEKFTPPQVANSTVPKNIVHLNTNATSKPVPPNTAAATKASITNTGTHQLIPPSGGGLGRQTQRPTITSLSGGAGDGVSRGAVLSGAAAVVSSHSAPASSAHPIININEEERQAGSGQSSPASSEGSSNSSGGLQVKGNDEVNTSSIGPVSAMIEKLNKTAHQPHPAAPTHAANQSRSNFTQRGRVASQEGNSAPGTADFYSSMPLVSAKQGHLRQNTPISTAGVPVSCVSVDGKDTTSTQHPNSSTSSATTNTSASQVPHPSSAPHLNQKPAPTYRYASKTQIANTYLGRLGSAAMDRYQRNLNLLYKTLDSQANKSSEAPEDTTSFTQPMENDAFSAGQGHPQFGVVSSPNYPDIASDKGSYKLNTPKQIRRRHSDSENEDLNKVLQGRQETEQQQQQQQSGDETKVVNKTDSSTLLTPDKLKAQNLSGRDLNVKNKQQSSVDVKTVEPSPAASQITHKSDEGRLISSSKPGTSSKAETVVRRSKSNLKKEGSRKSNNRVSFDPLALLLDASLEGELDLVKKVAVQVEDVSTPNDEGITALHNAICAGHYEIVKFLVEFGCDVNSPDSDGWTPLHCAASCNNLQMVRLLVEHGACVFAATISDHETAADKCEEEEDGYDGCSDYLYSIQEKLGIANGGEVYAVFDYQATNTDELSFVTGEKLTVLRKGDDTEKEWWWARLSGKEGYIPRNLLGLCPRVKARPKEVSEC